MAFVGRLVPKTERTLLYVYLEEMVHKLRLKKHFLWHALRLIIYFPENLVQNMGHFELG
jgi:hypothetical protein